MIWIQTAALDICSVLGTMRDINELTCSRSRGCSIATKATCPLLATSVGSLTLSLKSSECKRVNGVTKSLTCLWQQGNASHFLFIPIFDSLIYFLFHVCGPNFKVDLRQLNIQSSHITLQFQAQGVENPLNFSLETHMRWYVMLCLLWVTCFCIESACLSPTWHLLVKTGPLCLIRFFY